METIRVSTVVEDEDFRTIVTVADKAVKKEGIPDNFTGE